MRTAINQYVGNSNWRLFCFFVFLLPFLSVLNLPRFDLKVMGIGLGAFLTYLFAIGFFLPKLRFSFRVQKIIFLLGVLIVLLTVKFAISGSFVDLAKHIQSYLFVLIFYFFGSTYLNTNKKRSYLKLVFINCAVLLAVVGIVHFHFFSHIILAYTAGFTNELMGILDIENMKYRESATIPNPVHYAHILSFGIIFIALCMRSQYKWIIVATLLYAIIISGSRSALYYSLFFLFITQFNFRKTNRTGLLAVLIFELATVYFSNIYKTFDITNIYNSGIYIRVVKLQIAKQLLFENISNFLIGLPLEVRPAMDIPIFGNTSVNDNSYASILCEIGTIGFLVFFLIVKKIHSRFKRLTEVEFDSDTANYINATKWCAISFLIFGLANSLHKSLFPTAFISIFLGSVFNIRMKNNKYTENDGINRNHKTR